MADLTTVKEVVKEALVGTEADVQLSAQSRSIFEKNARKDEETGELFMGEEEFINAVAPPTEDYVSQNLCLRATAFAKQLTDETCVVVA